MTSRPDDFDRVLDVRIEIRAEVARKTVPIADLLDASPGHVVMLDRLVDGDIDVYAADKLVGQGQVVIVDEEFGIRMTEIFGAPVEQGVADGTDAPSARWAS